MRAEIDAQRAVAQRILDEMERGENTVPVPAGYRQSDSFGRWMSGEDEPESHYVKPKVTFAVAALVDYEEDPETGCLMWTGDFGDDRKGAESRLYPVHRVAHDMCGHVHLWVARAFYEEALGRVLAMDEKVWPTCETNAGRRRPCVAPAHHRLAVTS